MRTSFGLVLVSTACAALHLASSISAPAQDVTDVLSYHGNTLASNGVNATETMLTPGNVNPTTFGKEFTTAITDVPNITGIPSSELPASYNYTAAAGQVYAEPLVKTGVNITTGNYQGVHNVVFVATSMDSLYAIDADGGTILWKDSFIYNASGNPNPLNATIPVGVTAVPAGAGTEINSGDIAPWVGIVSTPVIDGVNGYIYVAAKTREVHSGDQGHPHYVYTLHKVSLSNGVDTTAVIADTTLQTSNTTYTYNSGPYVIGNGDGAITVGNQSVIYFNAVRQMIRPALELYNGRIYIGSASHGDNQPYHGWILTYDATSLACNGAWNVSPNGSQGEGGVWQGGGGVVIDSNGYIYFETGNGEFDGNNTNGVVTGLDANGFPVNGNYGDCFVKLELDSTTTEGNQGTNLNGWGLKVVDYFAPYNNQALNSADEDLGSGGPTILPDSAGSTAHPHLLIGGGKEGRLYLIDRDNMGKFGTTDSALPQSVDALNGLLNVPSFFNGRLYATSGYGNPSPHTYSSPLANATIAASQQSSSDSYGFPGATSYISANGTTNGIAWMIEVASGELRAYDASNLASELWTSDSDATRDALGSAVKFSVPTPVNGRVYVGTADHLVVYGPPTAPSGPPAAPTNLGATATSPSSIQLTWTDNSNNEDSFRIERSSDGTNFTQIASVGVNVTQYGDSGLSSQATYYYRVRAANSYNTLSYSAYTNIASATTPSGSNSVPVDLYHFDEGTGTTTVDSGSGANNGTLIGTTPPAWVTPGRIGTACLSFSGDGQYYQNGESAVQTGSDLSPVLGQTCSLLFWINTTQKGIDNTHYHDPAVTGVDELGGGNDINWGYLDSVGRIGVAVGDSGTVVSTIPVSDGTWHHVALTRDSSTGIVNIYIDGVLNATSANYPQMNPPVSQLETGARTTPFNLIGAMSLYNSSNGVPTTFTGATYFNGQLDDVQIFNQVVTASFVASVALPPAAPTNLVVTPASGTELDLSWTNNATNATGYEVWSSINGGPFTRLVQLSSSAVSYPATGLTQGTPYSFYVVAVGSAGSTDSNTVNSATPTAPATPTNVIVTYLSGTEVDLSWTDNATNETGYKVLRRTGTNDFAQIAALPANSTSYQDTTVSPGITYDYHIQAYNIAGYSDFAGTTVTTPGPPPVTLSSYLSSFGLTDTAPADDPNNTGIPNLLAYAFKINPTFSDPDGLPQLGMLNGYLTITYVQRIPPTDVTYTVQVSGDLVNWDSGPEYTTQVSITPNGDGLTETVVVEDNILPDPITNTRRFIRVNVTQ
jgi:hypothetical protein